MTNASVNPTLLSFTSVKCHARDDDDPWRLYSMVAMVYYGDIFRVVFLPVIHLCLRSSCCCYIGSFKVDLARMCAWYQNDQGNLNKTNVRQVKLKVIELGIINITYQMVSRDAYSLHN